MGNKEINGIEDTATKNNTAVPNDETNTELTSKRGVNTINKVVTNSLASMKAILTELESSQQEWPGEAFKAILSRWKQMPRVGWLVLTTFYCDKFATHISETMFKKSAKSALQTITGAPIGVRRFNGDKITKRLKKHSELPFISSLKESALNKQTNIEFKEAWRKLCKMPITEAQFTRKVFH